MVNKGNTYIYNIFGVGVTKETSEDESKKIKVLNLMAILSLLMLAIITVFNICYWDDRVTVKICIAFFLCIFLMLGIYFNYKLKYRAARLVMHILPIITLMVMAILFGYTLDVFLLLIVFSSIFFFEDSKTQYFISFVVLLSYLISHYYLIYYESPWGITEYGNNYNPILYFLFSVITSTILGRQMIDLRNKNVRRITELLTSIKNKNQDLLNSNEELERYAYILSHDLKSPINNIISFADLSKKKIASGEYEDLDTFIDFIESGGKKMNELVDSVLEYAILNKTYSKKEAVDLNEILKETIESLAYIIKEKNVNIESCHLPIISFDKVQMRTIFQNLIENGLKYNDSKIPKIEIRVNMAKGKISLIFKDNGIGIKKEYYKEIFTLFKRLHNDQEYTGSGIGLSKCKKIIEENKGQITVEANLHRGTSFIITFSQNILVQSIDNKELQAFELLGPSHRKIIEKQIVV